MSNFVPILQGVAAIVSAGSAISKGYQQEGQYNAQAFMTDRDALLARQEAAYRDTEAAQLAQRGVAEDELQRDKARLIIGNLRARMAAGGVDVTTGSPLDILAETAGDMAYERELKAWDTRTAVWKTRREGAIFLERAKVYDAQAGVYRGSAAQAVPAGWLSGIGTGLGVYAYGRGKQNASD
jgi:hypothetical protein